MPSQPQIFLIGHVSLANGRRVEDDINLIAYDATISCTDYLSLSPLKTVQGYFKHLMDSEEAPHPDGLYFVNAKVSLFVFVLFNSLHTQL